MVIRCGESEHPGLVLDPGVKKINILPTGITMAAGF